MKNDFKKLIVFAVLVIVCSLALCACENTATGSKLSLLTAEKEQNTVGVKIQNNVYREGCSNTCSTFDRTCLYMSNTCEVVSQDQTVYFYDYGRVYEMPLGGSLDSARSVFKISDLFNCEQEYEIKDLQIIENNLFFELHYKDRVEINMVTISRDEDGETMIDSYGCALKFMRDAYGYTDYILRSEKDNLVVYYLEDNIEQLSASTYSYKTAFCRKILIKNNEELKDDYEGALYSVELTKAEYANDFYKDPFTIVAYTASSALLKYGKEDTYILWDFDSQSYTVNPGSFAEYPSRPVYVDGENYYVDDVGTLYKLAPENGYFEEKIFSIITKEHQGAARSYNLGYIFLEDGKIVTTFADEAARDMGLYLWNDGSLTQISPDFVRNMKYIGDGYIYYKYASTDLEAGKLYRVKLDGTGWENMTEMLN